MLDVKTRAACTWLTFDPGLRQMARRSERLRAKERLHDGCLQYSDSGEGTDSEIDENTDSCRPFFSGSATPRTNDFVKV